MSINLEAVGLRVNPLAWEQIGDFLRARGIRCTYFLNSVGTATIQGEGFGSHIMGERSDAERHHEQQVLSMLEPCEAAPTQAMLRAVMDNEVGESGGCCPAQCPKPYEAIAILKESLAAAHK